jgi:hypothetical protein
MSLPIHPTAARGHRSAVGIPGTASFRDPNNFTEVFLGAFRRDIQSFFPGCRIEREPVLTLAGTSASTGRVNPTFGVDFQLDDEDDSQATVRVSLFGAWYRLSVARGLGFGPLDRELIRAIGRVMELHHQVLFRWSRMSLLQLRRGMPEDHYVAACVEPSAYSAEAPSPSRIAEAILTLRTMALSTYENRRVITGALIVGPGVNTERSSSHLIRPTPPEALSFGVELTSLKSLRRLCDGRRTLFLVDQQGKLADLVDIRPWALSRTMAGNGEPASVSEDESQPVLRVPCARVFTFHALATCAGGHVCLILSPNQEIKVFARGVQAFVFAHGRWRVLDPESKFALWEKAVRSPQLARVLFQTALDLAEERQGGLFVVVSDPAHAIGRLIAPHDVLDVGTSSAERKDSIDVESPARAFSLFGISTTPQNGPVEAMNRSTAGPLLRPMVAPLAKHSIHYLARGCSVTALDATVLEGLAGLDGALVTDSEGRLLAFGAILRHDAHFLGSPDPLSPAAEGARTTAALVASRFGPVLKISEDGIVSCFLDGARVWDL